MVEARSQTKAPGHPRQLTTQEPKCGQGAAADTFAGDTAPWVGGGSLALNESPGPGRSLKMAISALTYIHQPTGPPRGQMHGASRVGLRSRKSAPGPERCAAVTPSSGGNAVTPARGPSPARC